MELYLALILGLLAAVAATVWICVAILPRKKRGDLKSGFLRALHDIFNFKTLYIEKAMKVLYVFLTCVCIGIGFFMLFARDWGTSTFFPGLLILILGPVILRFVFEGSMLFIIGVRNVMEINSKLGDKNAPDNTPEDGGEAGK